MGNWNKKVDTNQKSIVEAIRKCGGSACSIASLGHGVPDLIVGYRGQTVLVEVKHPKTEMNPMQREWAAKWQGSPVCVVRSPEEVERLLDNLGGGYPR